MDSSGRPAVGTKRVHDYVEQCKRGHRIKTVHTLRIRRPLNIIRRLTQYWRNDYVGVEQFSRAIVRGHYVALPQLHEQHEHFAAAWNRNLDLQGFAEAFTDVAILG